MAHISQVNYEETSSISKNIHTDGDDLVQLHSQTRQRVHALRSEWIGEAADAFFEEMEGELLPALQRVSGAWFLGEEILNKIMKLIHEADEETAQYFKGDLDGGFGAGLGSAIGGTLGGALGGAARGDDFGASKFEEALPTQGGDQPPTGQGDLPQSGIVDESSGSLGSQYMDMQPPTSDAASTEAETPPAETETAPAGGGGGGGGGEGSQGMQGDLKDLGTGVGGTAQQVSAVGDGPQGMPDHVFEGSSGGVSGVGTPSGPAGGSGAPQEQSSGGVAGVAGAAGILGAAAAGAAKILKNDNNEPDE